MKRLKQFTRIAEPMRPTWPQPTTVSVALGSITTPPPPKGMPVNSRVGEEKQSGEIAYCLGKKTRWDGLNTDETNKVIRQEKINRLQRNPFLCVLTWAQGLRCEVCHLTLTPTTNACLRGACTLCNIFTAIHLNQQFALCAIPRRLLIVHEISLSIEISTHRWMKTVDIPKDLAIEHACWPPAPPKQASTCRAVSCPLASVKALIGRHMVSLATVIKPMATCSTLIGSFLAPSSWLDRNSLTW